MYKETRETVLTILLTALIVGGGMYWFYNSDRVDNVAENAENETVSEETVAEENESAEEASAIEIAVEETSPIDEVVVGEESTSTTEFEPAVVFEPKKFTNKISHYSVEFPKNWYWHHYTWDGQDMAAFDSRPLPETPGQETNGKIAIYVTSYQVAEELMASDEQWLTNVTKKTYMYAQAWPMTIMRGEMASPALTSPGATNVRMNAYITKDGQAYAFAGVGLTPEEEKIFEQMVASFRFEERMP